MLLLPHGFEGAGPEHSSARLERFLQLAAEDNMQVVLPTTPAQYFHLPSPPGAATLAKTADRHDSQELVAASRRRHPVSMTSPPDVFSAFSGRRRRSPNGKRRILLCCGKIYYDLEKAREERNDSGRRYAAHRTALSVCVTTSLRHALEPYRSGTPVIWVQEEPENMGAWRYLRSRFGDRLSGPLSLRREFPSRVGQSGHRVCEQSQARTGTPDR